MKITARNARQRPLVAMITNHGYAGPTPPIGAAVDTGGQNVYVNDQARAMEDAGYAVVIFSRGGFAHFEKNIMRVGEESMSDYITYVYLEGGGASFLPKEDIAIALDEEVESLYGFVTELATELSCPKWELFEFINSHYWDAGFLGYKLIERLQADLIYEHVVNAFGEHLQQDIVKSFYKHRHVNAIRHNWHYAIGDIVLKNAQLSIDVDAAPRKMFETCMQALEILDVRFEDHSGKLLAKLQHTRWPIFTINKSTVATVYTGQAVVDFMTQHQLLQPQEIYALNRHFWTPHSLAPIKERNYIDYGWEEKRSLKFAERRHHEHVICERTPIIVSTSEQISNTLVSHYNIHPDRIMYFPPCVSDDFIPRKRSECHAGLAYLSEHSHIGIEDLSSARLLLEVSRADSTKRKDLVLQGYEQALDDLPNSYLFIIGGPSNQIVKGLQADIEKHEVLSERVFVIPHNVPKQALVEIFAIADVYISASEMEGFGMSVLQATACKIPAVCSRYIPYATSYLHSISPVVAEQTASAYAQAIKSVLADEESYKMMCDKSLKASQDFTWKVRVKDMNRAAYNQTILFSEVQLDNFSVRLGEQREKGQLLLAPAWQQ